MWYLLPITGVLLYYLVVWQRATPTLRPRSVVTRYDAPGGLSPAAVRYVWMGGEGLCSGGADPRSLAAMLADLACRKQLSIQTSGAEFALQRTPDIASSPLNDEEEMVIGRLLPTTQPYGIHFDGRIFYTTTRFELEKALWNSFGDTYFTDNLRYRLVGIGATLLWAFAVCSAHAAQWGSAKALPTAALLGAAIALGGLAIDHLRDAPRLGFAGPWLRRMAPYLVSAALAIAAIVVFSYMEDGEFAATAAAMLVINLLFGAWLRAPTALGQQTLDEIAGYREFLDSVERPRLDSLLTADESFTAGLDPHLGYVIALDVRDHWGDKLTAAIASVCDQEERALRGP